MKTTIKITQHTYYPHGEQLYRMVIDGFIEDIVTVTEECPFFEVNKKSCPYTESKNNPKIMVDALTALAKEYP